MKGGGTYRDVDPLETQPSRDERAARAYIAVIGIDRYRTWNRLYNAVSDARGALELFEGLGFELVTPPLFDESATGEAIRRLVVDDLSGLSKEDSLVLFFAGHGHTMTRTYGGTNVRDGYLIPADGDRLGGRTGTWVRLESWLTEITRIPAKHILVILDACHSGLALGPIIQWRSRGMENARREPLEELRVRRSRRIITSALDDEFAMDGGPVPGHSLFTGCLIEAITSGIVASTGHRIVTGSEIGHYVQRRVTEYPGAVQTPDFGALELDDRGELLVHLQREGKNESQSAAVGGASEIVLSGIKLGMPSSGLLPHPIVVEAATQGPVNHNERHSPTRGGALYLRIGGGIVMVILAGVAALLTTRNSAFVEGVETVFGELSDARSMADAPSDGALMANMPDAAQADIIDATEESGTLNTGRDKLQQPNKRGDDASLSGSDMPPFDDRGN